MKLQLMRIPALKFAHICRQFLCKFFPLFYSLSIGGSRLGASEQAKIDAEKIRVNDLVGYKGNGYGDYTTAGNRDFVNGILSKVMDKEEINAYTDKEGKINADGISRVKRAVLKKAYEDDDLISKLAESTDNNIKNIVNGLYEGASELARARQGADEGIYHKYESISKDISEAVKKISSLREAGTSVEEYLHRERLFEEEREGMKEILKTLDKHKRSSKEIGNYFKKIGELIIKQGDPRQVQLIEKEPLRAIEILKKAREAIEDKGATNLFEEEGNSTIEVTGKEFGEYKDIKDLRAKAIAYYKEELQGTSVDNKELGKIDIDENELIEFTTSGRKKLQSTSREENKILLIKHLPEILKSGYNVRKVEPEKDKHNSEKFYYMDNECKIKGEVKPIHITLIKRNNGDIQFYNYNLVQKEEDTSVKTARPESSKEALGTLPVDVSPSKESITESKEKGKKTKQEELEEKYLNHERVKKYPVLKSWVEGWLELARSKKKDEVKYAIEQLERLDSKTEEEIAEQAIENVRMKFKKEKGEERKEFNEIIKGIRKQELRPEEGYKRAEKLVEGSSSKEEESIFEKGEWINPYTKEKLPGFKIEKKLRDKEYEEMEMIMDEYGGYWYPEVKAFLFPNEESREKFIKDYKGETPMGGERLRQFQFKDEKSAREFTDKIKQMIKSTDKAIEEMRELEKKKPKKEEEKWQKEARRAEKLKEKILGKERVAELKKYPELEKEIKKEVLAIVESKKGDDTKDAENDLRLISNFSEKELAVEAVKALKREFKVDLNSSHDVTVEDKEEMLKELEKIEKATKSEKEYKQAKKAIEEFWKAHDELAKEENIKLNVKFENTEKGVKLTEDSNITPDIKQKLDELAYSYYAKEVNGEYQFEVLEDREGFISDAKDLIKKEEKNNKAREVKDKWTDEKINEFVKNKPEIKATIKQFGGAIQGGRVYFTKKNDKKKFIKHLENLQNPKFKRSGKGELSIENVVAEEELSQEQRQIAKLSEEFGVPVIYIKADEQLNGAYANGITYLNVNSKVNPKWIYWHEVGHWLKAQNPQLMQGVIDKLGITNEQVEEFKERTGREDLTNEEVKEEIFADNMSDADKRLNIMQRLSQKDVGLLDRLISWLKSIMDKFTSYFNSPKYGLTREQMNKMYDELGKALRQIKVDGKARYRYGNTSHVMQYADGIELPTVYSFAGEKGIEKNTVKVTGEEFGEYNDIKDLRNKAKAYYKQHLQGTSVRNPILGEVKLSDDIISFTRTGLDKMGATSAYKEKILLVKHLPELIRNADRIASKPNEKDKRNASQYSYLHSTAMINDELRDVNITIFTDANGNKYYNHNIKDLSVPSVQATQTDNGIPTIDKSSVDNISQDEDNGNTEIKYSFQKAYDKLAKALHLKGDKIITEEEMKAKKGITDEENIGLLESVLISPSRITHKTFRLFYQAGVKAMNKLVRYRDSWNKKLNQAFEDLNNDDLENLSELLVAGDIAQEDYSEIFIPK